MTYKEIVVETFRCDTCGESVAIPNFSVEEVWKSLARTGWTTENGETHKCDECNGVKHEDDI